MCMRSLGHIQRERQDLPGALVSYEQVRRPKRLHTDQLVRCCLQVCCVRNVLNLFRNAKRRALSIFGSAG